MATQDVADALNAGCARTTSELKVVMKAKRPSGKVQLSWRCSSRRRQTRQSERKAEQRRHPRSRRSAEVKLGKGLGGIVSMTVSSAERGKRAATRLAEEAKHRQ
jgi:hypothetical protein